MSRSTYRRFIKQGEDFPWLCDACKPPTTPSPLYQEPDRTVDSDVSEGGVPSNMDVSMPAHEVNNTTVMIM